jgi:3-dehydroquinate synthase
MKHIRVRCQGGSYPVEVGIKQMPKLKRVLKPIVGSGKLFLICDAQWYVLHGARFERAVGFPRSLMRVTVVPPGERTKSARSLEELYDCLLSEGIERGDFILACGGGVTSDLAGYAAATLLRGVRWGVVPTTLVGMIDAAIGGKTGIDHDRGKNLIGAFWQPKIVWSDLEFLHTLDSRQMVAGLGELVKCAGLAGGRLVDEVATFVAKGELYDVARLKPLVERAAAFKASVVSRDERDIGRRQQLNYGHTVAHAIERAGGYRGLLHGEAVILGMSAALELSEIVGMADEEGMRRFAGLVDGCMRMVPRRKIDQQQVLAGLVSDKKRRGGIARFVLLRRPGRPVITSAITPRKIEAAVERMLANYREIGGSHG